MTLPQEIEQEAKNIFNLGLYLEDLEGIAKYVISERLKSYIEGMKRGSTYWELRDSKIKELESQLKALEEMK